VNLTRQTEGSASGGAEAETPRGNLRGGLIGNAVKHFLTRKDAYKRIVAEFVRIRNACRSPEARAPGGKHVHNALRLVFLSSRCQGKDNNRGASVGELQASPKDEPICLRCVSFSCIRLMGTGQRKNEKVMKTCSKQCSQGRNRRVRMRAFLKTISGRYPSLARTFCAAWQLDLSRGAHLQFKALSTD
jgi:hypothetical protein